jgi:arabinan endo-1,5-alpha-L-arabinosidase
MTTPATRSICMLCALLLAACGGGGGGSGSSSGSSSSSSSSSSSGGGSSGGGQAPITFQNASVHDPSVIRVGGDYYVFGSHLAAARTSDLMNWTMVADGVNNSNPLFTNVLTALQDTFAWSQVQGLWAADVVRLASDNRFYFYYNSCRGDSPRSALGVAVADSVSGPYVNQQILLRSGMTGLSEDGITNYDAQVHPNVVDPQTFYDHNGNLWMIYGSYSGGIFILAMNEATGLHDPGQGYGKHLLGGNHARIEGAYVIHNPTTGFYYLFTSFGGLAADGGYNIRVARSPLPDGPYLDAMGTDMATVKGLTTQIFHDPSIAPHAQKLVGNFQFANAAGETGTTHGYVSPGHNSAFYDSTTGKYFLFFHTRFPGRGEQHEIRVHELFFNSQGWPVLAPLRYVPLALAQPAVVADVTNADTIGEYKMVNHDKDISATIKQSVNIRLNADGTLTSAGAPSGTWIHRGDNLIEIAFSGVGPFHGVLSRQWNHNANRFVVTFSAQTQSGISIWGIRTGS